MRSRAFTIVEVLVVIVIITVLVAITFPIMYGARRSVHQTRVDIHLRQSWLALELYRQDYDGAGQISGSSSQMGLPNVDQQYFYFKSKGLQSVKFSQDIHELETYYPRDKSDIQPGNEVFGNQFLQEWLHYSRQRESSSVVIGHFFNWDKCTFPYKSTCILEGHAVTLGGNLIKQKDAGGTRAIYNPSWWN